MQKALRIILTIIIFSIIYIFCYWESTALLAIKNDFILNLISFVISGTLATLYWIKSDKKKEHIWQYMIKGGFIVGAISFLAGFIGPMIFVPESNLGPLLGIFFTGPIGFILGLIGGGIFGYIKSRKIRENNANN